MSDEHIIHSAEKLPEYLVDPDTWKPEGPDTAIRYRCVPDKKVWFCESRMGELLMFVADLESGKSDFTGAGCSPID